MGSHRSRSGGKKPVPHDGRKRLEHRFEPRQMRGATTNSSEDSARSEGIKLPVFTDEELKFHTSSRETPPDF
ncbi:hypothetical protein AMEX_G23992 [Astyanax mexicanus]|uniref:Uncharacterized protein n=1 Tax=Astyanax mexicanus TaxID=7994 RepID=A0A8T2KUA6_ASTMX|nr:hypothetical protein AMEX_G23992 [Astyanax mexicanus]